MDHRPTHWPLDIGPGPCSGQPFGLGGGHGGYLYDEGGHGYARIGVTRFDSPAAAQAYLDKLTEPGVEECIEEGMTTELESTYASGGVLDHQLSDDRPNPDRLAFHSEADYESEGRTCTQYRDELYRVHGATLVHAVYVTCFEPFSPEAEEEVVDQVVSRLEGRT